MTESAAAEAFLAERLRASLPGLRIEPWPLDEAFAHEKVAYYRQLSGQDLSETAGIRIWADFVYQVVVVAPSDTPAPLLADARLVDVALHRRSGSNAYGQVLSCVRIAPLSLPFVGLDRRTYQMVGGRYSLRSQAA